MDGGIDMNLIDLALDMKDFAWAKQIMNIEKEPISETNNTAADSKNYIPNGYDNINEYLKSLGQYKDYKRLKNMISGLDVLAKVKVIKNLGFKDSEVKIVLDALNKLT